MFVKVDPSNIGTAAEIHSVSWKESHRWFCSQAFVDLHTPEHQIQYFQNKIRQGSAVYMLVAQAPVGVVTVTENQIEDLYVLPDYQNKGYGTQLLRYAIGLCRGVPTLWILENNVNAERLYLRMGFRETGRRNTLAKGLDEIELALPTAEPLA